MGDAEYDNDDRIKFLWKKVSHLRVEIQLQSLHSRFMSTLDCQINLNEPSRENMINNLYEQQYKLLRYLTLEIIPAHTDYEKKENDCIQGEILTHLQNVFTQF